MMADRNSASSYLHHKRQAPLRTILTEYFSDTDLRILGSNLGVDLEILPGSQEGKARTALELVKHFAQRERLPELIDEARSARPDAPWHEVDRAIETIAARDQERVINDFVRQGDQWQIKGQLDDAVRAYQLAGHGAVDEQRLGDAFSAYLKAHRLIQQIGNVGVHVELCLDLVELYLKAHLGPEATARAQLVRRSQSGSPEAARAMLLIGEALWLRKKVIPALLAFKRAASEYRSLADREHEAFTDRIRTVADPKKELDALDLTLRQAKRWYEDAQACWIRTSEKADKVLLQINETNIGSDRPRKAQHAETIGQEARSHLAILGTLLDRIEEEFDEVERLRNNNTIWSEGNSLQ